MTSLPKLRVPVQEYRDHLDNPKLNAQVRTNIADVSQSRDGAKTGMGLFRHAPTGSRSPDR
jgi:hypothetical protein